MLCAVGEALATDTNALEHTVARQLVHYERSVEHTRLLLLVGDDTADSVIIVEGESCCVINRPYEVRMRRVQHSHKVAERSAVAHRHSGHRRRFTLCAKGKLEESIIIMHTFFLPPVISLPFFCACISSSMVMKSVQICLMSALPVDDFSTCTTESFSGSFIDVW